MVKILSNLIIIIFNNYVYGSLLNEIRIINFNNCMLCDSYSLSKCSFIFYTLSVKQYIKYGWLILVEENY